MTGPWIDEGVYGESDFWWDTDLDHAGQSIWGFEAEEENERPGFPF